MKSSSLSRRTLTKASLALAGTVAVSQGTSAQVATPASPVVSDLSGDVLFWVYPFLSAGDQAANEETWANLVEQFGATYPNVNVTVEVLPWAQRNEKLITALASGSGPDVGYLNDDFIPQHALDGNLLAVDDVIAGDKSDFLPNSLEAMSYDGSIYGFPILGSVTTVLANDALFTEVGQEVPTTWDELLAAAPAFKDAGYFITSYNGAIEQTLNMTYYPLLRQAGGDVLTEDNSAPAFNGEEGVKALEFVKNLYDNEYIDQGEAVTPAEAGNSLWEQGQVAMLMAGEAWQVGALEASAGEGTVSVHPPLKDVEQVTYGTSAGLSVFSASQAPEAATAWAQFVTSGDVLRTILPLAGFMPPRQSLSGLYADDPVLSAFEEQLPLVRGGVRHPQSRAIISTVAPYIQAGFMGDQPVQDALDAAAEEVQSLLDS